jgi:archaellum biogenesis ATPase FlaH
MGVGICHAYSGTVSVDVDHWQRAETELALSGINLQALFDAPDAVSIESGRGNHGKLLYRMPLGLVLNSKKLVEKGTDGKSQNYLDFRCGTANGATVQDVLPGAAIHPDTGMPYRWAGKGHYTRLPVIPEALLAFWLRLLKKDSERKIKADVGVNASWDEIRSALGYISPDISRDKWIKVGMALHWAGEQTGQLDDAFQIWDEWSEPSAKYKAGEMETQWLSFHSDKNSLVKLGTLYHEAYESGWVRPLPDATELFSALPDAGAAAVPAATPAPQVGFVDVSIGDVLTDPEPPHKFVVGGIVPAGALTLFSGHGGSGKSTMAIELAMHVAMGRPYLGMPVDQTNVLIMSAEDGGGVLRQRIGKLCRRHGIEPTELAKRLTVLDATSDPILWAPLQRKSTGPTDAYNRLAQRCNTDKIGLMVVDNSSDAFSGDAFDKSGVTQFVRHLTRCVSANNGAVVLLAHVNRTTASASINSTGSWSDSVAWHNAARSRLYLDNTNDRLQLVHEKSNFGPLAKTLQLSRHPDGGFASQSGTNGNDDTSLMVGMLRFVKALTDNGDWVGTSTSGTQSNNVAKKPYRDHPEYPEALRSGNRNADAHRTVRGLIQAGLLVSEKRWHGRADARYKANNEKPLGIWLTEAGLNLLETGELPVFRDHPPIEFPNLDGGLYTNSCTPSS